MRVLLLTMATSVVTAGVIMNAYSKKHQFYPAVSYLLKSSRSMSVLYIQTFLILWQVIKFAKFLFFGTLRAIEVEHLIERSWFAVLDTFILLAAFHEELSPTFVGLIVLVFVMKSFHCLALDRVDHMEQSPVITWKFHIRMISLLILLGSIDALFISEAWSIVKVRRRSVAIVFGLEYAIMLIEAIKVFMKYVLHSIDLMNENPWENKPIYLRYLDIVLGVFELLLYAGYMVFMILLPSIPLHIARRIYRAARDFHKSVYDVITSHQAIRNLNTLYPDATTEELQTANNVCIICREEMVQRCKKLPCNHIFHTSCLRSWFQEQHTCPTCRLDVLRNVPPRPPAPPPGGAGNNNPPPHPQPGVFPPMMGGWIPPPPHVVPPPNVAPPPPGAPPPNTPPPQVGQPVPPTATPPVPPSYFMSSAPPTMGPQMFFPPPPPPPITLNDEFFQSILRGLPEDKLRELEGMERANVEARIVLLRNIQQCLDAAMLQMNQYSNVMSSLNLSPMPGFPYASTPQNSSGTSPSGPSSSETNISQPPVTVRDPPLEEPVLFNNEEREDGEQEEKEEGDIEGGGGGQEELPNSELLRQRRLQRFYSTPASMSSLREERRKEDEHK